MLLAEATQPPPCPLTCPTSAQLRDTGLVGHQPQEGVGAASGCHCAISPKATVSCEPQDPRGGGQSQELCLHGLPAGSTGATPEGQGLGRGSRILSPHPTSPPIPLSSPPSLVPQASAAPVTDPQAGLAWALGCPGSRASGPAVAREAVSVLGTNSCRPGSSPTHPRAGVPPMAQPSLPRASPRGRGAPCPHVLGLAQGVGGGLGLGLTFGVLKPVAAEARPPVASL